MRTIFDKPTREDLIERITLLNDSSSVRWGKMSVYQMVKHNSYWNGWILGKDNHTYNQSFLGKVFGQMALRKMIKDEKPFDRNIPTSSQFKVEETNGDLEAEKLKWILLTRAYESYDNPNFIHDFFGKMTREQIGILVFKHSDHHLRQFGL
ncbi:DUF1569 domain-containing protein [Pontibacter flavimaris]|uniref:DUF1569 domain-containing protein n=1 Tax=Pontibacter flavimaris TaxID=1797110 RepID=A0A1Q5PA80_9BACT|nr:DUF1569 domain-containing protein [Pontibacter flavimaris]OKL39091.1 hypothetical protein A3841_03845 [Pontibacter flavimaris]